MNLPLHSKSILFFGPETFSYEKEIVGALSILGASVVYRSDKPDNSLLTKGLLRLFPKLLWRYADWVFGKWLRQFGPELCDLVFVVKGEGLSPEFLETLKLRYPSASFIFYLWDSLENVRFSEKKFPKFDQVFSFDPNDCSNNPGLRYRPLFFLEKYFNPAPSQGQGCFFVGTLNGDRPAVLARLNRAMPAGFNFDYWLFVRSSLELQLRKILDSQLRSLDQKRLLLVSMTSSVVTQKFQQSAAILDIEHPNQVGLTMRTFEVLASGKKLITTNISVLKHDFYDPSRIYLIDRLNPRLDIRFFETPATPLPADFYAKYSLSGWILEVLSPAFNFRDTAKHETTT